MAEVEMHEECGVVGMYASPEQVSALQKDGTSLVDHTYWALKALQNRGRDSAGIAANYFGNIGVAKGFGSIPEALPTTKRAALAHDATITIGQNRYATAVGNKRTDPTSAIQPFVFETDFGEMAIGHNGNL